MNTLHKGRIAELKVTLRALEKGFTVSVPVIESRYDMIIDTGTKLLRAQVKYGGGTSSHASGVAAISLRRWNGNEHYQTKPYADGEVDVLLVYIPSIDSVVSIPPEKFVGKPNLYIRLEPSKNNQVAGTLMAKDFLW